MTAVVKNPQHMSAYAHPTPILLEFVFAVSHAMDTSQPTSLPSQLAWQQVLICDCERDYLGMCARVSRVRDVVKTELEYLFAFLKIWNFFGTSLHTHNSYSS